MTSTGARSLFDSKCEAKQARLKHAEVQARLKAIKMREEHFIVMHYEALDREAMHTERAEALRKEKDELRTKRLEDKALHQSVGASRVQDAKDLRGHLKLVQEEQVANNLTVGGDVRIQVQKCKVESQRRKDQHTGKGQNSRHKRVEEHEERHPDIFRSDYRVDVRNKVQNEIEDIDEGTHHISRGIERLEADVEEAQQRLIRTRQLAIQRRRQSGRAMPFWK
jgi:hypothetical protein